MSEIVIVAQNLCKRYLVGHQAAQRDSYATLRDVIAREARNFARKTADFVHGRELVQGDEIEEFWALRDVSFELRRGEVLGIIGGNGAGKSTLLKILSRITEPTRGRVSIRGRVASLLEVGTGFHPELSGRENIYLNGAILGMTQKEVRQKFDAIIAFAEIEQFLDTPVKRYSSGMYMRLGFSVAAHLDPEILIVDEVLAVGDAAFQQKCLGKMSQVASELGRTVLFVSHNMLAIQAICDRALLLNKGAVVADAKPDTIIRKHLAPASTCPSGIVKLQGRERFGRSRHPALESVWLENAQGGPCTSFTMGETLRAVMQFCADEEITHPGFGFGFEDERGQRIFSFNSYMDPNTVSLKKARKGTVTLTVERLPLLAGSYSVTLAIVQSEREWIDCVERAIHFTVEPSNIYSTGRIPERSQGVIFADAKLALTVE